MRTVLSLLTLTLILSLPAFAQYPVSPNLLDENGKRTGHWTVLYDSNYYRVMDPESDSVVYYRLIKYEAGIPMGKVRDFYKNGYRFWDGYLKGPEPHVFDGESNLYHENGKLKYKQIYADGKRHGASTEYHLNGNIASTGQFKDDMQDGTWKYYHENGNLKCEYTFKEDSKTGPITFYYQNGQVESAGTFIDNKYNGVLHNFYESGAKSSVSNYKDDEINGPAEYYHENGKVSQKCGWKNGKRHGPSISYYDDGTLKQKGDYFEDNLVGYWVFYFPNGKLKSHGKFVNNEKDGPWEFYYESGKISDRGNYKNGFYEGEWIVYYENGNPKTEAIYHMDSVNGKYITYYESGKKENEVMQRMNLYVGLYKSYKENGEVSLEGSFVDGLKQGKFYFYYSPGVVESVTEYVDDVLQGYTISYHPNGRMKDKRLYKDGLSDSIYTSWYDDGTVQTRGRFEKGKKQGTWTWYLPNGFPEDEYFFIDDKEEGPFTTWYPNGKKKSEGARHAGMTVGPMKFYYRDGDINEDGFFKDNLYTGKWTTYDSALGYVANIEYFEKGKRHGKSTDYNAKGKVTGSWNYIHGFKESSSNIRDSIEHLLNIHDYPAALKAVEWMDRISRQESKKEADQLLTYHMRGRIYSGMRQYEKGLPWTIKYLNGIGKYEGKDVNNYKTALHNVASALHGLNKYDEALKYYDQAIEKSRGSGLGENYWSSVNNKVYCLYDAGREEDAAKTFDVELAAATAAFGPDSSAGWYLRRQVAEYYYDRPENFEKSKELWQDLLDDIVAANAQDNKFYFEANRFLGEIYYLKLDKNHEAIPYYTAAVEYAESNKMTDWPQYADMLTNLFYIYKLDSEGDTVARRHKSEFATKLKLVREIQPDPLTLYEINLAIGNDYYDRYVYDSAYLYFDEALRQVLLGGKENTLKHASVLQSLAFAGLYTNRSYIPQSQEYFVKSVAIRKEIVGEKDDSYYNSAINLAAFYVTLEKYEPAIAILNDMLKITTEVKDEEHIAKCHQYLGEAYYQLWRYSEAIEHYLKSVEYFEKTESRHPRTYVLQMGYLSSCYKFMDNFEKAREIAEKAVAVAERHFGKENDVYIYRQSSLASIYERFNLYNQAIKIHEECAKSFYDLDGRSADYLGEVAAITNCLYQANEYKKAIERGEAELKAAAGTKVAQSDSYMMLSYTVGYAYNESKKFQEAEKYYKDAIDLSSSMYGSESPTTAIQLMRLGNFYDKRNRMDEAEAALEQAVANMKASDYKNTPVMGNYLINLAAVKKSRDKNKEAEDLYIEAFDAAKTDSVNSQSTYVDTGKALAGFYSDMGRLRDAEKLIKRITWFIQTYYGRKYYYASVREQLVHIYYRQSMYDEAETEARDLLQILAEESGSEHWLVLNLRNYLGIIYDDLDRFEDARKEFAFCVEAQLRKPKRTEIEEGSLATFYSNLARVELCLGLDTQALAHYQETEKIRKAIGEEQTAIDKAGYQSKIAAYYLAVKQYDKAEAVWAELTKGLLAYTQQNFYFMSDEEKSQFWRSISAYFRIFDSFAVQRAKQNPAITAEMYNIQLATKAVLLSASNKIRKRILSSRDTSMVNMYYRWTNLREQLAQVYSAPSSDTKSRVTIDSLQLAVTNLEKEMNISVEDLNSEKGGDRITWKNVQAVLAPDEAAVEILRFKHYDRYLRDSVIYAALVITAETRQYPKLVILNDGRLLEGRVLKFYRNSIASHLSDSLSYKMFWAPLDPALKGKTRVYLSLDGVYNQINLNTLMNQKGEFLVDQKNLTYLSNTKDLLAIKSRKARRLSLSSATLFGFPTYFLGKDKVKATPASTTRDFDASTLSDADQTGIAPLLGTMEEVQKVSQILSSHRMETKTFLSEAATEHQIKKLQHPRVLHIATHGFFVEENDDNQQQQNPLLRAGLLLAGASNFIQNHARIEDENGILTAYEAANLDLDNTDLVVLSACETGKGEVQNGEGVYGLQRAFQTAGAQSIIMSLWKVDDEATQLLMTRFYTNWMSGMSKAEALKAAQVALKQQYPHPYYWGAFVMLEN